MNSCSCAYGRNRQLANKDFYSTASCYLSGETRVQPDGWSCFSANAVQFCFGRGVIDPLKRLCEAFFELQCKCDGAPSMELARPGQLARPGLEPPKFLTHHSASMQLSQHNLDRNKLAHQMLWRLGH